MKKVSAIFLVIVLLAALALPTALATDTTTAGTTDAVNTSAELPTADGTTADGATDAAPTDGTTVDDATTDGAPAAPAAPETPLEADPRDLSEGLEEGAVVPVPTGGTGDTKRTYMTLVVNAGIKLAGQPFDVGDIDNDGKVTINDALILAHETYHPDYVKTDLSLGQVLGSPTEAFPDGVVLFGWGIDATYNIYMVNTIWGLVTVPFMFMNGASFGGTVDPEPLPVDSSFHLTVTTRTASNGASFPTVVMTYDPETMTVTAQQMAFDLTTFGYTGSAFGNIPLVDAETGKPIDVAGGQLNSAGKMKLTADAIPPCGVVMVPGNSAIRILRGGDLDNTVFRANTTPYEPPPPDYSIFGGASGQATLRIVYVSTALTIPLAIIVWRAQTRELKNRGRTFAKPSKVGKR